MKIANVVYENELINHTKAEYVNYIQEPIAYDDVDKSLATLYVGWNFMKACNPENKLIQNADILKKKIISNTLYWECNFKESKSSHVKGVTKFVEKVPDYYFSKFSYTNLDPVFFNIRDVKELMDVVPEKIDFLYQYKDEMIYLLVGDKITGINLKMYDFFQFDINHIVNYLLSRTKNNQIELDLEADIYKEKYKTFPNYTHLKRYMIILLKN